ncbi:uncharacterized protein LOC111496143 isoform X2 [Cucurbita maxima]|uniref:Uncharacterized protein LOC111496143 isoform X2 n=1 Tax=Cucurbita maxima TaxID=3661 RepID=A0A6J1KKR9_CUCMA|nr:uncharacterized protein LOC111496143 isoform X2 [Cucurbita maxima]
MQYWPKQQQQQQQAAEEEAVLRLFYNLSTSFFLLFFFISFSSILLFKFLHFLGTPLFPRNEYEYEYNFSSEEEEEEEEEEGYGNGIHGETGTVSYLDEEAETRMSRWQRQLPDEEEEVLLTDLEEPWIMDSTDPDGQTTTNSSVYESPQALEQHQYHQHQDEEEEEDHQMPEQLKGSLEEDKRRGDENRKKEEEVKKVNENEKYLVFAATKMVKKEEEEIFGDSCTVGSTSKSSSEWRSSINCRDSGTDDPFSSSSRRSCPKWESYTVFQKYDEEMMFLHRITAQKLHETESLRLIQMCPRSVSERIVHKLSTINKKPSHHVKQNPYQELEAAYVAQICWTWEALNWNYNNFVNKKLGSNCKTDLDTGCPAKLAQQFQQFQVLLQRYIENEPYDHGRRPEIYARMRRLAPNLLQVPEFIDEEQKEDGSRISSHSFQMIMEEGIRTYMNFLKADKEKPSQIVASFFKRKNKGSVDPNLLQLMNKVNQKKTKKLKHLRRAGKCLRRKRKMGVEEEMEILMGLIDLKVVSRVLRSADIINEQQLHWCEAKMRKVRILDGKLHRDSSPIFFPPH